jgi:hypothetical protein
VCGGVIEWRAPLARWMEVWAGEWVRLYGDWLLLRTLLLFILTPTLSCSPDPAGVAGSVEGDRCCHQAGGQLERPDRHGDRLPEARLQWR